EQPPRFAQQARDPRRKFALRRRGTASRITVSLEKHVIAAITSRGALYGSPRASRNGGSRSKRLFGVAMSHFVPALHVGTRAVRRASATACLRSRLASPFPLDSNVLHR